MSAKLDDFIPFDGNAFFQAVEGLPETIALGYLRAIWHYWAHTHCEGLRDDEDYLRKVCRIEKDEWEYARQVIFDDEKFFTLDDKGLWHQKRAREDYQQKLARYNRIVEQRKAAAKSRWS